MSTPLSILKQYWGYSSFRPAQEPIIQSILEGKDTLALLPTGGGKSICYQVPALCLPGLCVVVSPLIALMKDQVFQLKERGVSAVAIHSGLPFRDIDRLLENCMFGNVKLLYLSPERLSTEIIRERIPRMHINLLAVDEAHCISQWGYDFRPSYLKIAEIRAFIPETPVLALTATATPDVIEDIQVQLDFEAPRVFRKTFVRPNLSYSVFEEERKLERLVEILRKVPGSAVVYVRNRRKTKEVAAFLQQRRISADFYHAGLNHEERSERQEQWILGKTRVMVSTNAFGMGIDKPDVRSVVHLDLPESLEAYFQEAGRAGRDGQKAYGVLLYEAADVIRLQQYFAQSFPE
ncbi:MAG: ATP-dependent DNA helicase RecQ, partial [Phaeodactylibacter sp.]|nr:ATP-dependent DNA helicase RecQ [Phaeodactylibacter sp.]